MDGSQSSHSFVSRMWLGLLPSFRNVSRCEGETYTAWMCLFPRISRSSIPGGGCRYFLSLLSFDSNFLYVKYYSVNA